MRGALIRLVLPTHKGEPGGLLTTLLTHGPWAVSRTVLSAGGRVHIRLFYRTREDFDAPVDSRDDDPRKQISRVEIANPHATVLARFLDANS